MKSHTAAGPASADPAPVDTAPVPPVAVATEPEKVEPEAEVEAETKAGPPCDARPDSSTLRLFDSSTLRLFDSLHRPSPVDPRMSGTQPYWPFRRLCWQHPVWKVICAMALSLTLAAALVWDYWRASARDLDTTSTQPVLISSL